MGIVLQRVNGPVNSDKRLTFSQALNRCQRDFLSSQFFLYQASEPFFFLDQKARGWQTVRQWETGNCKSRMIEQQIQSLGTGFYKVEGVGEFGVAPSELRGDDLIEAFGAKDREGFGSLGEVVAGQNAHQTQVMVAMEVRNKNVGDAGGFDLVSPHLDLCSFAAVYQ